MRDLFAEQLAGFSEARLSADAGASQAQDQF
jgi:hypothetical protein